MKEVQIISSFGIKIPHSPQELEQEELLWLLRSPASISPALLLFQHKISIASISRDSLPKQVHHPQVRALIQQHSILPVS